MATLKFWDVIEKKAENKKLAQESKEYQQKKLLRSFSNPGIKTFDLLDDQQTYHKHKNQKESKIIQEEDESDEDFFKQETQLNQEELQRYGNKAVELIKYQKEAEFIEEGIFSYVVQKFQKAFRKKSDEWSFDDQQEQIIDRESDIEFQSIKIEPQQQQSLEDINSKG